MKETFKAIKGTFISSLILYGGVQVICYTVAFESVLFGLLFGIVLSVPFALLMSIGFGIFILEKRRIHCEGMQGLRNIIGMMVQPTIKWVMLLLEDGFF